MAGAEHPAPFLEIRVERIDPLPPLAAACAGYELGEWRARQLSRHVMEWLPEFALRYEEWSGMNHADAVAKIARAAASVYASDNYRRRGEFGEILLHILLRQHARTIPAISKIYFKDARNDTVKGFDAVHVLERGGLLELWLGEAKFYTDIAAAIREVVAELQAHTERDYLRAEFAAIVNKLDPAWPRNQDLRSLLATHRSLDSIFTAVCIPVLLTYESDIIARHASVDVEYQAAFEREVLTHWEAFRRVLPDLPVRVYLYLFPLKNKAALVDEMHQCLRRMQELA